MKKKFLKKNNDNIRVSLGSLVLMLFCTFLLIVSTFITLDVFYPVLPAAQERVNGLTLESFYKMYLLIPQVPAVIFGGSAFVKCAGLTSVTIPNSVTSIGVCAFLGCSRLTLLTIENATPPEVIGSVIKKVSENITICVLAESVEKYKAAEGWSEYADKIKAKGK